MADPQGIIARTVAALKYAATGNAPTDWFGPGTPLTPQAPESVAGRQFDYPVTINLNYNTRVGEATTFARLKSLADNCGPLRMVIERQKDLMEGLEWSIKPKGKMKPGAQPDPECVRIAKFFEKPDGIRDWAQWLRAVLEQNLVLDALSIYSRPSRGGGLFALELIDGSTIKPLLDQSGRTPLAPDAAYQQILKGMPAVNYTTAELLYYPQNYRADRVYGYSRVEQIKDIVEAAIQRAKSQLGYFTHGNIGDGYFTAPVGATPDQVIAMETHWNAMMTASIQGKRQSLFLPAGFEWHGTKTEVLQDVFDEWLIRLICFGFGVSPTPFMKQTGMGHGSAKTDQAAAQEGGVAPLMQFVRRLMNRLIADRFGRDDLEFAWSEDREFDPETANNIDDIRLKNGSRTINEVRDRNGELPIDGGDQAYIYLPTGPIAVDGIAQAAEDAAQAAKDAGETARLKAQQPTVVAPPIAPDEGEKPAVAAGEETEPKAPLTKAAPDRATRALRLLLNGYLAEKRDEIVPVIADALGMAKTMDDASGRIERALDEVDWRWDDLPPLVSPTLIGVAVAAGKDAVSDLGLFDDATLKLVAARAAAWAEGRAAELVGMQVVGDQVIQNPNAEWSISDTTRDMLRSQITAAIEDGSSDAELAKTIRESTAFSSDRAETIARNETATAQVQGQIQGWKQSGLVGGRKWLVAPGCCDLCQALDGMIVGIDEPFPDGDAPLHPRCECDEVAVLTEDMPDDE